MCKICSGQYKPINNILGPFILDISNCFNVEVIPEYENNYIDTMIINRNKKLRILPSIMPCLRKLGLYFLDFINVPNYSNLREIKLINVNINNLPNNLNIIEILYMQNTNVTSLPNNMNNLRQLTINKSPIQKLPFMESVEFIQIFKSNIRSLNSDLTTIKILNISKDDKITEIPSTYINLEELYITMSKIYELPSTLCKLKKLYAHKCPLSKLNTNFILIEEIDVTCSNVKLIPKEYVNIKSITYDKKITNWDSSWYIEDDDKYKIVIIQRFVRRYIMNKKNNAVNLIIKWFRRYNNTNLYSSDNIILLYYNDTSKYNIYNCTISQLYHIIMKIRSYRSYYIFKSKVDIKMVRLILKASNIPLRYNTIKTTIYNIVSVFVDTNKIYLNNTLNNIIKRLIKIDNIKVLKENIKNIICQQ